jgi:predicted outer membrane repeat protein
MKFACSLLLRLSLGLLLLAGLCLALGISVRPAHAQSTLTVSDCSSDSQLQADVAQANSDNASDTITFSCSGDIPLSSTLTISGSMTLDGSGQAVTLDGQNQMQVLSVNSSITFTLTALTIAHGSTSGNGGGLANNGGTVSISNSVFTGNSVPTNHSGGAIYSTGSLTISNSTFTNTSGYFGTVYNTGNVGITNSTFAGNNPTFGGGGLYNDIRGKATITNSTIVNNTGTYGTGLFDNSGTATITNSTIANNTGYGFGGGIAIIGGSNATVNISGSIVANNSGGDCQNYGTLTDNGYNLDSDSSCFTSSTSLHTNPQLSGLADNGGPTQTMALQQGSPAIDAIPLSANVCPSTDQRGDPRPDVDTPAETMCDMGAYESAYSAVDDDLGLTNIPSNITTKATSPQGATVSYTSPTVVDEDSPLPPVNCSQASGTTFAIGTTTVTCTVADSDDSNSPVSQSFTVTVQPVLNASGTNVSATEGRAFSGVVATGSAYGTSNPLTATISWGDGSSSTISVTPNADGSYSVSGSHTYAEEGSYSLSVSIKDSGSLSASATGSAQVADAALTLQQFAVFAGPAHTATLAASFSDADPAGTVSDYSATVSWGDGSSSSATIASGSSSFSVSGSHRYAKKGTYSATLTVTDKGGSKLTKTVSVTVK